MAVIAHLSDLHFGRHDPAVVAALEAHLIERRPDLVAISGDLTQRARIGQFRLASAFLRRLRESGLAVMAVPGNHDVPLYDVLRRFMRPLHSYRKYIDDHLCPHWENDELVVLGVNTARSFTFKDGSISHEQMQRIRESFDAASGKLHVLVTHHPLFAIPFGEKGESTSVARRSDQAVRVAAEAGIDLLLAGHFHRSLARAAEHVENVGPALIVQAGTATSTRLRGGEKQSFNWIEAHSGGIDLTIYDWDGAAFRARAPVHFSYDGAHWQGAAAA